MAKRTLDEYLRGKEAMLNVDEESMWAILAPKRRRWATDGSFIAPDQRTTTTRGEEARNIMTTTIQQQLTAIENHIQAMDKAASAGVSAEQMQEGWEILTNLAGKVDPTTAADFGFDGEVGGHAPAAAPAVATAGEPVTGLTFDTFQGNTELATNIIAQSEETSETIDRLASEGKKFNAERARTDLHAVTSKVAGILDGTSLTEAWVAEDLQKLATRSAHLHGLFHPTK